MKYLVTGSAGFIGFHLVQKLLSSGNEVTGIDNLNPYYDPALKNARNDILVKLTGYTFHNIDLCDKVKIAEIFKNEKFDYVINLAAQAGVRYSIENPDAYIKSNIDGFLSILECCRNNPVKHLIYASSSSVYGANTKTPFSEKDFVDHPVSLYAATKKSNELMAHTYAHLFKIPSTGLRFFTVYGPWGRPDMAYFKFTKSIIENREIEVFNDGDMKRDFTYIDDIINGILSVIPFIPQKGESESGAPCRVLNIGNNNPVYLGTFIEILESILGKEAVKKYLPMQEGDVYATYADITALNNLTGWKPLTDIDTGLKKFVEWYKEFYK